MSSPNMEKVFPSKTVPAPECFIPSPHFLELAATRIVVAHYLRIRFLNLMRNIRYSPLLDTLLENGYSPERLYAVKAQSSAMYDRFEAAGKGFRDLDGLDCEHKWVECHEKAMSEFGKGVKLLEAFESEADNLAVEWECTMMFPLPKVAVGGPFPGIEDRNDYENNHAGRNNPKPP